MDTNEPIDNPKSDISCLFTKMDLADLHYHCYPSLHQPAMHQCRSKVIDLIAGSPLVTAALLNTWMHPFGDPASIKGDHWLLGIDLDLEVFFGQANLTTYHQPSRGTNSCHAQIVTKYCKQAVTKCNNHQLAKCIATLQALPQLDPLCLDKLENIDTCLTKILLQSTTHVSHNTMLHGPLSLIRLTYAIICRQLH